MSAVILIPSKYGNTGLTKLGEHTAIIILPGILCGILGYAVGNYLGLGFGAVLQMLV